MRYVRIPTLQEIAHPGLLKWYSYGIFRNKPGIKPGRWGFYFYGFEFGSRNPGDPIGVLLNRFGLWRW